MTAHLLVTCDGTWPPPAPGECTGKIARPLTGNLDEQRQALIDAGWSLTEDADLCPTHVRLQATT